MWQDLTGQGDAWVSASRFSNEFPEAGAVCTVLAKKSEYSLSQEHLEVYIRSNIAQEVE